MAPIVMIQQRSLMVRIVRPAVVSAPVRLVATRRVATRAVGEDASDTSNVGKRLQNDLGTDEARQTAKNPIEVVLGALTGERWAHTLTRTARMRALCVASILHACLVGICIPLRMRWMLVSFCCNVSADSRILHAPVACVLHSGLYEPRHARLLDLYAKPALAGRCI